MTIELSEESRTALGVPAELSRTQLRGLICSLQLRPDSLFPRGKWATIQALEGQLAAADEATERQEWDRSNCQDHFDLGRLS